MSEAVPLERRRLLHCRALRLEWFTVGWNVVEGSWPSALALWLVVSPWSASGWTPASRSSARWGLLWRLRTAGPTASVAEESAAERRALYIVAATFFLLAAYIAYEAGTALLGREAPDRSTVGLVLSVLSLVIMPLLAYAKQRTGRELGSRALVADSVETWVCSYLSLALLAGVGLHELFGWWWADPAGALAMLPVIVWQGWETLAEAREDHDQAEGHHSG